MADVALDALPDLGRLIVKAAALGVAKRSGDGDGALPDRAFVVADLAQDAARLAAYDRVCGFPLRDAVPATWLHVLTFPLQAALMSQRDFPFPLAGLVHLSNAMTLHRPVTAGERLGLRVWADALGEHRRGVRFDVVGEVRVGDEVVWTGRSTYLSRRSLARTAGGAQDGEADPDAGRSLQGVSLPAPSQQWRLPPDLGRRYAGVSGDVNPLHLYPLTARPFGFSRPLIHGMWTHARALSALGGRLPGAYSVDVTFTKPILLPATVAFGSGPPGTGATASGVEFAVMNRDGTRPFLVGNVR